MSTISGPTCDTVANGSIGGAGAAGMAGIGASGPVGDAYAGASPKPAAAVRAARLAAHNDHFGRGMRRWFLLIPSPPDRRTTDRVRLQLSQPSGRDVLDLSP